MLLMKESTILGPDRYGLLNIIRRYSLAIELRLGSTLYGRLVDFDTEGENGGRRNWRI